MYSAKSIAAISLVNCVTSKPIMNHWTLIKTLAVETKELLAVM